LVLFRDGMEESKKNKAMYCKLNKRQSKKKIDYKKYRHLI
jgi:hypothetical protein